MPTADGAIIGAHVRTLDADRPAATAIAWRGGVITAVGADDEVRRETGAATRIVDGRGRTVLPGLTDSHIHPFWGTLATRGVDLRSAATLDAVRGRLAEERRRCGDGAWVLGHSVRYEPFHASGIRADAIEDALGDAPALLSFYDGHTALATRPALQRAGRRGRAGVPGVRGGRLRPGRQPDRRAARERRDGPRPRRRARVDGGRGARRLRGHAPGAQPRRPDRRARDGRRPGAARHLPRPGGARRPLRQAARPDAPGAVNRRRGGRAAAAARARARPPVARRHRQVLPRRRARLRHRLARRAGPGRR